VTISAALPLQAIHPTCHYRLYHEVGSALNLHRYIKFWQNRTISESQPFSIWLPYYTPFLIWLELYFDHLEALGPTFVLIPEIWCIYPFCGRNIHRKQNWKWHPL